MLGTTERNVTLFGNNRNRGLSFPYPSYDFSIALWEGLPRGSGSKVSACNAGDLGSIPGLGRFPLESREEQPTLVFLPGEFHGQRSLTGYSPWGHKESDTTEQLTLPFWETCLTHNNKGSANYSPPTPFDCCCL